MKHFGLYSGKVRVSTVVIIAIVVPVGVSIALFCLGFGFLRRRGRKNRDSVKEKDGKEHNFFFFYFNWKKAVPFCCVLCRCCTIIFSKTQSKIYLCCVVGDEISTEESLQFDLSTIEAATNNFSPDNKLGEGGFGEVYKVGNLQCVYIFKNRKACCFRI